MAKKKVQKKESLSAKCIQFIVNPVTIVGILLAAMALFAVFHGMDFGINWDTSTQRSYGIQILKWYASRGKDMEYIYFSDLRFYGPLVETITQITYHILKNYLVAHLVIVSAFGILGLAAAALVGFEMESMWMGTVAMIMLILAPRYFGDMFTNSKDIPFAAFMILGLWGVIRLVKNWDKKIVANSIIVGAAIGCALSVRVTAIFWYAMLIAIVGVYWIYYLLKKEYAKEFIIHEVKKQVTSALIIFFVSYGIALLCWPYLLASPVGHFIGSVEMMSHHPFNGLQLFLGKNTPATKLPRSYSVIWYLVTTPLITLAYFAIGLGFFFKEHMSKWRTIGIAIGYVFFIFAIFLIIKPNLANGIRQILFILPAVCIVAAYGFVRLIKVTREKKWIQWGIIALTVFFYGWVVFDMVQLHPYEFIYFNQAVGGVAHASKYFDADYYGTCLPEASKWLAANYKDYSTNPNPVISIHGSDAQVFYFAPSNFIPADMNANKNLQSDFWMISVSGDYNSQPPQYKVIHTISRDNAPLCLVKANTSLTTYIKTHS